MEISSLYKFVHKTVSSAEWENPLFSPHLFLSSLRYQFSFGSILFSSTVNRGIYRSIQICECYAYTIFCYQPRNWLAGKKRVNYTPPGLQFFNIIFGLGIISVRCRDLAFSWTVYLAQELDQPYQCNAANLLKKQINQLSILNAYIIIFTQWLSNSFSPLAVRM